MPSGPEATRERLPPWQIDVERRVVLRDGHIVMLRPLRASDAEGMAAFFAALTEHDIYYFYNLDGSALRALALNAAIVSAYRLVAVDTCDQRVLGYAYVQQRDMDVPIFGVCLQPDAQSIGLGWRLVDYLFTTAAASGLGRVALTVHPDNVRALRLYQRVGFRLIDEFTNSHQGVKQYRMEADLQGVRPFLLESLAIVPVGGVGVGLAAAVVQRAIESQTRRLPLILSLPPFSMAAIFVADFTLPPAQPILAAGPITEPRETAEGWITNLDQQHLLISGVGVPALTAACQRYIKLLQNHRRTKAWLASLCS